MLRAAIVAIILLTPGALRADAVTEAAAHFERAKASYNAGDYPTAIAAFQRAFELDDRADYLFGWAQAVRKSGDCPGALVLYRKLLAMQSPDEQAYTRQSMSRCVDDPATGPLPPPPPAPPIVRDDDVWYRDWTGHALAGGGLIALGAGTWLTARSISDERAARDAPDYGEHDRLTDRATTFRIVGIASIAAGTVAVALGVYRYTSSGPSRTTVTAWATGDAAGIAIGGTR